MPRCRHRSFSRGDGGRRLCRICRAPLWIRSSRSSSYLRREGQGECRHATASSDALDAKRKFAAHEQRFDAVVEPAKTDQAESISIETVEQSQVAPWGEVAEIAWALISEVPASSLRQFAWQVNRGRLGRRLFSI